MKTDEFDRKDGTKGTSYRLEDGDKVVAMFDKVGSRENLIVKDGKPLKIMNHFLGVTYEDKEITLTVTGGQKKVLDKITDLTGKTIIAVGYENDFGEQVGCRVKA